MKNGLRPDNPLIKLINALSNYTFTNQCRLGAQDRNHTQNLSCSIGNSTTKRSMVKIHVGTVGVTRSRDYTNFCKSVDFCDL
jgi:hypothetical protein